MTTRRTIGAGVLVLILGVLAVTAAGAQGTSPVREPGKRHCAKNCTVIFTKNLPGQAKLTGFDKTDATTGMHTGNLEYSVGGRIVDERPLPNDYGDNVEMLRAADCDHSGTHCLVSYGQGAHGGGVTAVELAPNTGIVIGDKRSADIGTITTGDLNGDGVPDAAVRFSTYQPNFAQAPQFWGTLRNDDGALTLTGCDAPTHDFRAPAPTTLLVDKCPFPGRST